MSGSISLGIIFVDNIDNVSTPLDPNNVYSMASTTSPAVTPVTVNGYLQSGGLKSAVSNFYFVKGPSTNLVKLPSLSDHTLLITYIIGNNNPVTYGFNSSYLSSFNDTGNLPGTSISISPTLDNEIIMYAIKQPTCPIPPLPANFTFQWWWIIIIAAVILIIFAAIIISRI